MSGNLYLRPGWYEDVPNISAVRRAWRSTTLWIVLFSFAFWLASYQYFASASARDPTSYFFDENKGYQRLYSLEREEQGYKYIQSLNVTGSSAPPLAHDPLMCIGVATIARPTTEQYVRGTIGSLLEGLSTKERSAIHLTTFVAHTDPSVHPIYTEPWLTAVSNNVLTYDVSDNELSKLRSFEEEHHSRNKSMFDYGYILSHCLQTGARWITIVEDDVIARQGWYDRALASLKSIQEKIGNKSWLYMRMFYTEGLLGWNSEEWIIYLAFSLAICLMLMASIAGLRARSPVLRRHVSNGNIGILCFCCLPPFIALYFMAGRMTVHPPAQGVQEMPRFGCCSQGFIFPREIVPLVIERTKQAMNEDLYIDMLLERFADKQRLTRFAIFPSLLQHIGSKSSKGWGYDEHASEIFNFGFENLHT